MYQLKMEMSKLAQGMVLEVDAGSAKAIRGTKGLITRASKQLGRPFVHWHQGTKVFAKPAEAPRRQGAGVHKTRVVSGRYVAGSWGPRNAAGGDGSAAECHRNCEMGY